MLPRIFLIVSLLLNAVDELAAGTHDWEQVRSVAHIVNLRALALSDRWDAAMAHTLAPLRKAVVSCAHETGTSVA